MAEDAYAFDEQGAARIVRAVTRVERMGRDLAEPPPRPPAIHGGTTAWARVTSLSPTDGRYPGILRDYDPAAKTFSDFTDSDCWLVPPDGTAPELSTEYLVRLQGEHTDNKLIWLIVAKGSPGGSGDGVRIRELDGSPIFGPVPGVTWDQSTGIRVSLDVFDEGSGQFGLIENLAAAKAQWGVVTATDQVLGNGVKKFSSGVQGNIDGNAGSPMGVSGPGGGDFAWFSASSQTVAPALYVNGSTGQVWSGWPSGAFGGIGTFLVGITSCTHILMAQQIDNNGVGLVGGYNSQTNSAHLTFYKGHPHGAKTYDSGALEFQWDGNFGIFYVNGAYAVNPYDIGFAIGINHNDDSGKIYRGGLLVGISGVPPQPAGGGDGVEGGGGDRVLGGDPDNPEIQSPFRSPIGPFGGNAQLVSIHRDPIQDLNGNEPMAPSSGTTQDFTAEVSPPGTWIDVEGMAFTLEPGTHQVVVQVNGRIKISAGTSAWISARLYNQTAGAAIAGSECQVVWTDTTNVGVGGTAPIVRTVEVSERTEVRVQGTWNGTHGGGGVSFTVAEISHDGNGRTTAAFEGIKHEDVMPSIDKFRLFLGRLTAAETSRSAPTASVNLGAGVAAGTQFHGCTITATGATTEGNIKFYVKRSTNYRFVGEVKVEERTPDAKTKAWQGGFRPDPSLWSGHLEENDELHAATEKAEEFDVVGSGFNFTA